VRDPESSCGCGRIPHRSVGGEFGNVEADSPVRVEIVGDILTSDEAALNFSGANVDVTPLSAGPTLVMAESVPQE